MLLCTALCSACVWTAPAHAYTMTARAFLRLSDDLREAFASAQDDESVRYLRVEVVNGDTLTKVGSSAKGADIKTDFDSLAQVRNLPMY